MPTLLATGRHEVPRSARRHTLRAAVSILLLATPVLAVNTVSASAGGGRPAVQYDGTGSWQRADTAEARAARGLALQDLRLETEGPCRGGFSLPDDPSVCTPGPDPAAAGVDVRRADNGRAPLAVTAAQAAADGLLDVNGALLPLPAQACGTDGPRVQALYVRSKDVPDRFSALLPQLQTWAMTVNSVFERSAAKTGGSRQVRFATGPDCLPQFESVVLSARGDDSWTNTVRELKRAGYKRSDRKYLVWMDAGVYCGLAQVTTDSSPGANNEANTTAGYSRIDRGCWNGYAEAHELAHMLGSVQLDAPNSNGKYHCKDDSDRMCYSEGGVAATQVCDAAEEPLLDCGDDDYFHTSPEPGSYLATHWNVANSVFLTR